MSKSTLQTMVEHAGFETRSYSGRGMYGKQCLAVTPHGSVGEFLSTLFEETIMNSKPSQEEKEAFGDALRVMQTDSMGRGIVIYFPGVDYTDDEDDDAPDSE